MKQSFRVNYTKLEPTKLIRVLFTKIGLLHLLNIVNMHLEMTEGIIKDDGNKDSEWREELKSDLKLSQELMGRLLEVGQQNGLIEEE